MAGKNEEKSVLWSNEIGTRDIPLVGGKNASLGEMSRKLKDKGVQVPNGFSIGPNNVTQLALGLERDSSLVSHIYDERNDAVKRLIRQVIEVAKEKKQKIGICAQAPSDFAYFAKFLAECGIDSISLIPDTAVKTRLAVAKKEKSLGISAEAR